MSHKTKFYFLALLAALAAAPASPPAAGPNEWTSLGLENHWVTDLAIDPALPDTLYAATNNGEVFKSIDGGLIWSPASLGLPEHGSIYALAIDPVTPSTLYVGTSDASVFKSTDGGESWSPANYGLVDFFPEAMALAIDPQTPGIVYTLARDRRSPYSDEAGLFKTTDGGLKWSEIGIGLVTDDTTTLVIGAATPAALYTGVFSSLYKTTDGGTNWSYVPLRFGADIATLAIDPLRPSTLFVGEDGSVLKSTNAGVTWTWVKASPGVPSEIYELVIDPTGPATLYAATQPIYQVTNGGVFVGADSGSSWSPLNNGLPSGDDIVLAIDPTGSGRLYAGTRAGVFAIQLLSVSSVSPYLGLAAGGTSVVVRGHHFMPGAALTFGGAAALNVTVVNSTTLTADLPAHTSGAVEVVVANPDGHSTTLPNGLVFADVIYQVSLPITLKIDALYQIFFPIMPN